MEEEEELVEWEPVEKLDKGEKFVCRTCPYEDLFQNVNNDIEEMKRTISEVYALQDKKQDKKKNKVKDIHIDIQKDIKEDINEDKDVVIKNVKDKQVKPKKKVDNKQKNNSKQKKENKKSSESKNLRLIPKIFKYFKIKHRRRT